MAEHWHYKTLELGPGMGPGISAGLVVALEDGQAGSGLSLSERLNQLAKEDWEIQTVISASQGSANPTMILRKLATD
jgi:hypothetical protein